MTLKEINTKYNTDKGITHTYLDYYETIFSDIKDKNLKILEIGVLFGNSLKLWNDYFINSEIYGIEDFSQKNGHSFYGYKPVIKEDVVLALSSYDRITLFDFNCEDIDEINKYLSNLEFDIIIDDASHALYQQKLNYKNYSKYLVKNGMYICEDVQSDNDGEELGNYMRSINSISDIKMVNLSTLTRNDDRIILIK